MRFDPFTFLEKLAALVPPPVHNAAIWFDGERAITKDAHRHRISVVDRGGTSQLLPTP